MKLEEFNRIWNEICFLLNDSIKKDINERDFENQVVRAIEKLGWLEYTGEVKRQPILKVGRNINIRPDIVIYGPKENELVAIEIKRPSEDLAKKEPAIQLISYMLQMKTEFGLLIGKRIRLYYDGKHNPQHRPLLLEKFNYERDSKEGIDFVSIFYKEYFLKSAFDNVIRDLIKKITAKKNIKELRRELLTIDTKNKIFDFLKNEFSEYGSEVIEGALGGVNIEVTIKAEDDPDVIVTDDDSGITGIRKTVYDTIKYRGSGISTPEIIKVTGFEVKQISNALYYLSKNKMVKTIKKGIYVPISKTDTPSSIVKTSIINDVDSKSINLQGLQGKIFNIIKQYKNGAAVSKIREKSELETKQVSNLLYKLTKRGFIQQIERGLYKIID